MISEWQNEWVSVSCAFYGLFFLHAFSSSPNVSVLFCLISDYCPIEACSFPNEKQKRSESGWEERWDRAGRSTRRNP